MKQNVIIIIIIEIIAKLKLNFLIRSIISAGIKINRFSSKLFYLPIPFKITMTRSY